ncbi:hypothetical protein Mapa_008776 [Marchantia paleacea]|nr:hypothetical protein Mapa_008776 [Marchantia paleacea]
MNLNALTTRPPSQPWQSLYVRQSMSSCSESEIRFPVLMALILSTAAIEANAQQLPQLPWFLIGVTAFLLLQSVGPGKGVPCRTAPSSPSSSP